MSWKTMEKSGLEPTAPSRLADRNHYQHLPWSPVSIGKPAPKIHQWTIYFFVDGDLAESSNFDCNNARCWNPLCWHALGVLRFQLHFTCGATLFLSSEVCACCDSAVDFTGKKVVSVVVIFKKIEVARDFCVPGQIISTSWGVCRLLGCSRRAPSAALRLLTVACAWIASPHGIKLSLRTCRLNSVSFHFTQTFLESPCCLQSCPAQELSST